MNRLPGLAILALCAAVAHAAPGDRSRDHRLPCDGSVSLWYGEKLIWHKQSDAIRALPQLVEVPDESGRRGLPLSALLEMRPNVAAIELETCQPRLRRFARDEIDSDEGRALYLVATRYRGFRLRNAGRERSGGGLKNIGRIVLVPAGPDRKTGNRSRAGESRGDRE